MSETSKTTKGIFLNSSTTTVHVDIPVKALEILTTLYIEGEVVDNKNVTFEEYLGALLLRNLVTHVREHMSVK